MSEKKIDPNQHYKIDLKTPVPYGRSFLRPGQPARVSGKVLEAIKEHVSDYHQVA